MSGAAWFSLCLPTRRTMNLLSQAFWFLSSSDCQDQLWWAVFMAILLLESDWTVSCISGDPSICRVCASMALNTSTTPSVCTQLFLCSCSLLNPPWACDCLLDEYRGRDILQETWALLFLPLGALSYPVSDLGWPQGEESIHKGSTPNTDGSLLRNMEVPGI